MPRRSFHCELCDATIEHDAPTDDVYEGIEAAQRHFELYHPEVAFDRWPDGEVVIVDASLEPDDFQEAM